MEKEKLLSKAYKISVKRSEEVAQQLKSLPCKQEKYSSDVQNPYKCPLPGGSPAIQGLEGEDR